MSDLSNWTLSVLVAYGVPILFALSYGGSLGIPFPISLTVIAAGAFAHEGVIDWRLGFLASTFGAVLADSSEYLLGWLASGWIERRFGKSLLWKTAQGTFQRQGGWAILLTRFWLTTLAPVINLIAGDRYPYPRFLLYDIGGQAIWVALYGGLGYAFADEWPLISQVMNNFTGLSVTLVILAAGVYFFVRWRRSKGSHS